MTMHHIVTASSKQMINVNAAISNVRHVRKISSPRCTIVACAASSGKR